MKAVPAPAAPAAFPIFAITSYTPGIWFVLVPSTLTSFAHLDALYNNDYYVIIVIIIIDLYFHGANYSNGNL
jgi:hypothetical protein